MFYFDEHAKEFTCHFSFNAKNKYLIDYFAVDYTGFISKTPSCYSIDAVRKTQVLELSYKDMQEISKQMDVFIELDKIINHQIHTISRENLIDINMLNNIQRYKKFMQNYKTIYTKIPQYIIASYLGITPVALSRLKTKC